MPTIDKPVSPKRRYGMRTMELSRKDPQIGGLMPDDAVWEKAIEEGLPVDRVVGVFLDGYAERPALGQRTYEVVQDPERKESVRQYLPSYTTITYGELHDRIKAISMAWRTHPSCFVEQDDFVMIMGFADMDFASLELACTYSKATSVPVQSSTSGVDLSDMVANIEPVVMAVTLMDLSLVVQLAIQQGSVKSIVVFNYDDRIDRENAIVEQAQKSLADAGTGTQLIAISRLITIGKQETWTYLPSDEKDAEKRGAILHSSGSTGKPKAAVILRKAIMDNWLGKKISLPRTTVHLAPLNHLMGRTNLAAMLACGGTGYFTLQPDLSSLLEDIRLARPTFLSLFPRVFELIHQHFQNEVARRFRQGDEIYLPRRSTLVHRIWVRSNFTESASLHARLL